MESADQNLLNSLFPANHAFLIAVQDYSHVTALQTPINDVACLAAVLALEAHDFQVHSPLINPDRETLETFVKHTIPSIVKTGDRVLVYFAGHGIALDEIDQTEPKGFLLPADARRDQEDSYLSMALLNECLQKLPCRHLLLLLDCCFAGSFQWAIKATRGFGREQLPKNIYRQRFEYFVNQPAWQVITSAAYHQQALDVVHGYALGQREGNKVSKGANSPFAEALVRALRDGAGDRVPSDGLMTVSEIFSYLQNHLAQISHIHAQKPAFFPLMPNHQQGEFVFLNPRVKLHLSDYRDDFNPYRGLQAYEFEHQNTFYGRERVVNAMRQKLDTGPLLIVSGDSGAGKSSAVKAGLLPELQKRGYRFIVIRPGAHPIEALHIAIRDASAIEKASPVVLLVDQLEELTTQYAPVTEREEFLLALATLIEQQDIFRKIILTVRSDFETHFEQSPLTPWWRDGRYSIPGFDYEELQEVVWQPMQERCIEYEYGLAEELIREVQNRTGGLPLLSFTLSELYEQFKLRRVQNNSPRTITWEDYQTTGGVVGALQNSADQAYSNLQDNAQRASLRHMILRLVSLSGGETASRRALHEELDFGDPTENERIAFVRDLWIEKRLLHSGSDSQDKTFIEPAHDALVRSWRQIQDWIQQYQGENILLLAKLGAAVEEYRRHDGDKHYLWDDNPGLAQVEAMQQQGALQTNRVETAFLEQSRRLQRRKRNTRNGWIVAAFISLAGLTVWSLQSNLNLNKKIVENGISNALMRKNAGQYTEACMVLNDTKRLISSPPPILDSLISAWLPLEALMATADSLNNLNIMKEALESYKIALQKTPDDQRIKEKIRLAEIKRDNLFNEWVANAEGLVTYSGNRYETQHKFAVEYYKNALGIKEDSIIRRKLNLLEKAMKINR